MRLLDELELREAEEYLTSPSAKILGATSRGTSACYAQQNGLEEAKRRQAEELEEARQRAEEEERLHKAESRTRGREACLAGSEHRSSEENEFSAPQSLFWGS